MSKVTYIIKASENVLNEKTAAILVHIVKNNFVTSAQVREAMVETLNASSVNSNIGGLIKKGMIEKSGDGLIATGQAMDLIQKAADLFAAENAPEMLTKRKTRSARGVTESMQIFAEFTEKLLKSIDVEVKEIAENRSNLEIRLTKRTKGIRQIEIRRDGSIRIFGYNMDETFAKSFSEVSPEFTTKIGGKNIYVDCKNITNEIIQATISHIAK